MLKREPERLIVVGGVAAGMSAASRAKRRLPDMEVVVFEKTDNVSYGACGFPYYIAGLVDSPDDLIAIDAHTFRQERNIDLRTSHEVTRINPSRRLVTACNISNGQIVEMGYSKLVLATGGASTHIAVPGAHRPNVFSLKTLESAVALKSHLNIQRPQRAVVIGAGYLGLEMAEALVSVGLEVTVVERSGRIMDGLDDNTGRLVIDELHRHGVELFLNRSVEGISGYDESGPATAVDVAGGQRFSADLVIVGVGVKPGVALAKEAGIDLGSTGAISVNWKQETSVVDIYAAGDCCEAMDVVTRRPVYVPLGTTANKQGRVAGENAAGGFATFKGVAQTAVLKFFDLEIARTGITERRALKLGYRAKSVTIVSKSRASYFPGSSNLTVRLVFESGSGKLLGGQLVGRDGAAARINTLATALHAGMTVEDLSRLDLAYAPPFSTVWDPILIAANTALKKV